MLYFVNYIKALACLLITHFHSGVLFPVSLSILAIGGDIGNNLFFAVSGFTLYRSITNSSYKEFGSWYKKRLRRLLPTLILFYLVSWLADAVNIMGFESFINAFIFPSIFWFTGAIIFFYLFLFPIEKSFPRWLKALLILGLIFTHLVVDGVASERYMIGFISMMVGSELRAYILTHSQKKFSNKKCGILLLCTGGSYIVLKLIRLNNLQMFGRITHLCIGLMCIVMALLLIMLGYTNEPKIREFSQKHNKFYSIINTLSNITLCVYLVQQFKKYLVFRTIASVVMFPLSYILSFIVIITISIGIDKFMSYLQEKIKFRRSL